MSQQEQQQPDIIYVNRQNGQIVPEGYPNAEAYIRLVDAQPKLEPDTTPDYESINLASTLQRKLMEETESINVWRNQINSHIQEHGDELPSIPLANFKSAQLYLKDATMDIDSALTLMTRTEMYLAKH